MSKTLFRYNELIFWYAKKASELRGEYVSPESALGEISEMTKLLKDYVEESEKDDNSHE
jgi:hypothetical protein